MVCVANQSVLVCQVHYYSPVFCYRYVELHY